MDKIIFLIFVINLFCVPVMASELTGKISTDPKSGVNPGAGPGNAGSGAGNQDQSGSAPAGSMAGAKKAAGSGSNAFLVNKSAQAPAATPVSQKTTAGDGVKVLGANRIADGTLVRLDSGKIYYLEGGFKKHILNLPELKKYSGKRMVQADESDLEGYKPRNRSDGELIREKGTAAVYVVKGSSRKHVLNLGELRRDFFGKEIFNIDKVEMSSY